MFFEVYQSAKKELENAFHEAFISIDILFDELGIPEEFTKKWKIAFAYGIFKRNIPSFEATADELSAFVDRIQFPEDK